MRHVGHVVIGTPAIRPTRCIGNIGRIELRYARTTGIDAFENRRALLIRRRGGGDIEINPQQLRNDSVANR